MEAHLRQGEAALGQPGKAGEAQPREEVPSVQVQTCPQAEEEVPAVAAADSAAATAATATAVATGSEGTTAAATAPPPATEHAGPACSGPTAGAGSATAPDAPEQWKDPVLPAIPAAPDVQHVIQLKHDWDPYSNRERTEDAILLGYT